MATPVTSGPGTGRTRNGRCRQPGRRESVGLIVRLRAEPIGRILSSPALRCQQTVQPLAEQRRLALELDQRLAVEADLEQVTAMVFNPALGNAVLCTHGELIGQLLGLLCERGAPIGPDAQWLKGSTWALQVDGSTVPIATYLPPSGRPLPGP